MGAALGAIGWGHVTRALKGLLQSMGGHTFTLSWLFQIGIIFLRIRGSRNILK